MGRCEGPPHSYVRMPYGLPNAAVAHQRLMRAILEAQEVRRSAALVEMEMAREEPPVPLEPPEAPGPGGSSGSAPAARRVCYTNTPSSPTSSGDIFQVSFPAGSALRAALFPGRVGPSLRRVSLLLHVLSLPYWGRPSGCIIPKSLGPDPAACTLLAFILGPCFRPTMLVIWCMSMAPLLPGCRKLAR